MPYLADLLGIDPKTIRQGEEDLKTLPDVPPHDVRKKGAGRKRIVVARPEIVEQFREVLKDNTAGNPARPLRSEDQSRFPPLGNQSRHQPVRLRLLGGLVVAVRSGLVSQSEVGAALVRWRRQQQFADSSVQGGPSGAGEPHRLADPGGSLPALPSRQPRIA